MNSTKTLTVHIEHLNPKGYGVAHDPDGREYWVIGAIPGEEVLVEVIKKKRKIRFAKINEIISRSEYRIESSEEHFLSCSPWQILNREGEKKFKIEYLNKCFNWDGAPEISDINYFDHEERFGYRNKMEFSFYQSGSLDGSGSEPTRLDIAFHKRDTKSGMIAIDSCLLSPVIVQDGVKKIVELLNDSKIVKRELKTLVARYSRLYNTLTAELFVKNPDIKFDIEKVKSIPGLRSFSLVYSDPRSPASVPTELLASYGPDFIVEKVGDKQFKYDNGGFFQVNTPLFEMAVNEMRTYIKGMQSEKLKRTVDLYAGVGTIGIMLADLTEEIIGVELYDKAEKYALTNAADNNIENYTFHTASADSIEADLLSNTDLLIIDPPRAGCSEKMIQIILAAKPQNIIYLSCNPTTQAEDLQKLSALYKVNKLQAFNFFPQTPHLESLAFCSLN